MRNVIGNWAGGEDFFGRERELASFQDALDRQANLLLVSPRRVGKTSLVIRLRDICRAEGWHAVWFNVENFSDEVAFVEALINRLVAQY